MGWGSEVFQPEGSEKLPRNHISSEKFQKKQIFELLKPEKILDAAV